MKFHEDLRAIMYGFGDTEDQYEETVDLLNEIVVDYMKDLMKQSANLGTKKIGIDSLLFVLRNDQAKCDRIHELLKAKKEIDEAKKQKLTKESVWFQR